jgi:hypothetical protein
MQLSRTRKEDFNFVLTRYAMERLLCRLSRSTHEATFILKGAMLFTVWSGHPHRAKKDVTTAYGILRNQGVELTMGGFLGNWGTS